VIGVAHNFHSPQHRLSRDEGEAPLKNLLKALAKALVDRPQEETVSVIEREKLIVFERFTVVRRMEIVDLVGWSFAASFDKYTDPVGQFEKSELFQNIGHA
jgi:hypothetical protein